MDRRDFLTRRHGRGDFGRTVRRLVCADCNATAEPILGRRTSAASSADGQRHEDTDQGLVREAVNGSADAAHRRIDVSRQHERHRGRILAVPCHAVFSPGGDILCRWSAPTARACAQPGTCLHFPPRTSRPESFRVLFFTCAGGPDSADRSTTDVAYDRESADRDSEPADAPRTDIPAASDGRQWRSRLLGLAFTTNSAGAQGQHAPEELQPVGAGFRQQERDRVETRRGAADRSGVWHGLSLDAGLLPAGRSRLLR